MMQEPLPTLPIGMGDLRALRSIVHSYMALLRRTVPPSRKREEEMAVLQRLYFRMQGIPADAVEVRVDLTVSEIQALSKAISGFAAFVRHKVPASRYRDETLGMLEQLRQDLVGMIQ
ncbi:MAG TPA: hypothetical protein VFA41_19565 [Ktedonobacteraceae bacterium]|jgi:hypothetical protein|nr:hypothetical protein [Ktedonobacteraceae bacterium]